jgi:hypothetical protein
MVAADNPGEPSPIRSYISAPVITFGFGYDEDHTYVGDMIPKKIDPLSDAGDPSRGFTLSGAILPQERRNKKETTSVVKIVRNPFTGRDRTEFLRVIYRDARTGEEVLAADPGIALNISNQ